MELLTQINAFIWGAPALILIISVGIYLTIKTKFLQIRLFPAAMRLFGAKLIGRSECSEGISSFQAMCTALAATVGTGNLAGIAGAIAIGGPGSIFWMWVCGLLGMITKYAEVMLSFRYRTRNQAGEYVGGPMYIIQNGMGQSWHWLAALYSFFGVVAAFGVGNATQINAVIGAVNSAISGFGIGQSITGNLIIGSVLALLIAGILMGGMKRIGTIAERLIPFAAAVYILLCLTVLTICSDQIPNAFRQIFAGAFCPSAVTGGVIGSSFQALRVGAARGVFTNEAGMGTAAIAHSSASGSNAHEQALMGIVEVFLDTIVICTMTALVILCSGTEILYGIDQGILLTSNAFAAVIGNWVSILIALLLCCFAIATVIGWGLYGFRCAQFLFGEGAYRWFVWLQVVTVILTAVLRTDTVWLLSEIVNGLMSVPNLIAICALRKNLLTFDDLMVEYHYANAMRKRRSF